jgi:predicted MFS family arabinose efflux permease
MAGLGGVFAASGVGVLLAAVLTPEVTKRLPKQSWIVICFALAAAAEAVFVVTLSEWIAYFGAFVLGVAAQGSKICVDTIVQTAVDDAYRGRVFSFYDVIFNIAFVSAAAFGALALPEDGNSRPVYAIIAIGYALTAAVYGHASRRVAGTPARTATHRRPPSAHEVDHVR